MKAVFSVDSQPCIADMRMCIGKIEEYIILEKFRIGNRTFLHLDNFSIFETQTPVKRLIRPNPAVQVLHRHHITTIAIKKDSLNLSESFSEHHITSLEDMLCPPASTEKELGFHKTQSEKSNAS